MTNIEQIVISNLITNEKFCRKVIPFIKDEYFEEIVNKEIFSACKSYINKYTKLPSKDALEIFLENSSTISDELYHETIESIQNIEPDENQLEWLVDETENWCKERSLFIALSESIEIAQGNSSRLTTTAIPQILNDALAVNFDNSVGLDYMNEAEKRLHLYKKKVKKYKFLLEWMNKYTGGGVESKTLNAVMAPTGGGKSIKLCCLSADYLIQGHDVLYVTLEMAEHKIAERIDANLFDVPINEIKGIKDEVFNKNVNRLKSKTQGNLIIKEFPTASINASHIRHLLDELRVKKKFEPKVIVVDYLNLMTSSRFKSDNMYQLVKSIAEELRGLAVETDTIVWTATQLNRCLSPNTLIYRNNDMCHLKNVKIGDKILSKNNKFNEVLNIWENKNTPVYKIKTKLGKEIICSGNHIFPTNNGEKTINTGLCIGEKINSINFINNGIQEFYNDEVISIEQIDSIDTIDIEVSGDNLFYANDILTHNSGSKSTDADITDVSESWGLPATLDFFLLIMQPKEMKEMGQYVFKIIKNRYGRNDVSFAVGLDIMKMRFYDVEQDAQTTTDGEREPNKIPKKTEYKKENKKSKFSGFKM